MSRKSLIAATAALVVCASLVSAQDTSGSISLELNRATASSDGGCQVVFFGQNGLDQALEEVTWRLAVFDGEGVFRNLLALPLGSLSAGKRRVVQYNLPSPCTELSEIIVNDVAQCKIAGSADAAANDVCLTNLTVSSRADIAFGL
ncbi:MAG: hypothetical protein AAFP16_00290 [Pseudomonadota bacterium]